MTAGRRAPGRVLFFLREHAGAAFCVECLANALGLSPDDVRIHVTEGIQTPTGSVEASRGRCSVCRAERIVARHRRGA